MLQVVNADQAERAAERFLSPRFYRLDKLERYVCGTQYVGRPDFYNPATDCPLLERAPNLVHSEVEAAIRQHADFAFGEGRWPTITCSADEDDKLLGEGLSDDQARVFDAFLRVLMRTACFKSACSDALGDAEGTGTAVTVVGLRDGVPCLSQVKAKYATPTYDAAGRELERVEVRYPYLKPEKDRQGQWQMRCMLYRRVIDRQKDTVYLPVDVTETQGEPTGWQADPAKSSTHGLGWVPVVWYALRESAGRVGDVDGHAIHDTQLDELDGLNFSLSQRGRAALYCGDPQVWESGRDDWDEVPGGMGRTADPSSSEATIIAGHGNYKAVKHTKATRPARRKGAGVVWSDTGKDYKVGMLTLPGDSLDAISKHLEDLEQKIGQVLGYTVVSPEQVKGAVSGKALGFLFSRTTSYVDGLRGDFWQGWMKPCIHMLLRLVSAVDKKAEGSVWVRGLKKALPILATFVATVAGAERWMGPALRCEWPKEYFPPTAQDEQLTVQAVVDARAAKVITLELALAKLRGIFPHDSSEAIAKKLQEEHDEQEEAAAASIAAQNKAALAAADEEEEDQADEPDPKA